MTANVIRRADQALLPLSQEANRSWRGENNRAKMKAQRMGVRNGAKIQNKRDKRRTTNNTRKDVERIFEDLAIESE
jgi:hypothetical protein